MTTGVIIPSAGKGARMKSGLPKQMLEIGGMTILGHTISRILAIDTIRHLVIPASGEWFDQSLQIANRSLEQSRKSDIVKVEVIQGGAERMYSVKNGLAKLMDEKVDVVVVHDAVRPCFPLDAVNRLVTEAMDKGAAILAVPVRDTVKLVDDNRQIKSTPDRSKVWLAQTPQAFRRDILFDACEKACKGGFLATDDASMAEFAGYAVHVVEGSQDNIKITYPSDLYFAEKWLELHTNELNGKCQ